MIRKPAIAVAMAIGAAAAIAIGVWGVPAQLSGAPREGGPLAGRSAYGYAVTVPVGGEVTDALLVLSLPPSAGTDTVELESVEQIYPAQGAESGGVWVAGADRSREAAVVEQFYRQAPPTDPRLGAIREVRGAVVRSRADVDEFGVQLLLATRVTTEGHFLRDGIWVTYRSHGTLYRDRIPAKLTICTPSALESDGTCAYLGQDSP